MSTKKVLQARREDLGLPWLARSRFRERNGSQVADWAENLSALAAVFLSPMNFLRLPFFYFTLSDAFACICLFILVLRGRLRFDPIGAVPTVVWLLGLCMLLTGLLVSSMINGDPLRGTVYIVQYFFAYFILLVVIGSSDRQRLLLMSKVYVASILLMCLHGAYVINIVAETNTTFVSGSGRLTGFVERENECSALIALSVPMMLTFCFGRGSSKLGLLALPFMGYGVMLTGSNTGLASFLLGVGLFCALTLNVKLLAPIGALSAILIVIVQRWGRDYLPAAFQRRVLGALESGDLDQAGSFQHRVQLIHEAIGRTKDTFLFGLGADQYALTSVLTQPVHNLYLLLWTEGGFLSMVGFIVMIGASFGPALSAWQQPGGRHLAASAICTVCLFLFLINAFPSVYGRFWAMPIILTVALANTCRHQSSRRMR
ncbi:O-antigen ligase family protein [Rhizobium sullae]|uniref:O-antigen ligase n=1 Tax=Rhizobium sullae TaxID=50338 RepID=A0A4R3QAX4_RHISU|nr:O-antigen ligase family protein [Rhizobium sullae]TCU15176.1 O-antigen ligase [Rhizobium sullae]